MIRMRIHQMDARGIKYCFMFNGEIPSDFELSSEKYFHFPELSIEKYNDKGKAGVWATRAFQETLQKLYTEKNLDAYEYILRLNATTFVNFNKFEWMLQFLPKKELVAGPLFTYKDKIFANGTAMLFSRDVARAFTFETKLDEELTSTTNDDVVISWSLMDRYYLHDLNLFYVWFENLKEMPPVNEIFNRIRHESVFYRVKNDGDLIDINLWFMFMQAFH